MTPPGSRSCPITTGSSARSSSASGASRSTPPVTASLPPSDSAVAGLRCAAAILDALRETGVEVRIGVHTGEVELMGNDIGGVAVHAAARIMALASPSEVFASAVTVGLADGSGLVFEGQGARRGQGTRSPDRGASAPGRLKSIAAAGQMRASSRPGRDRSGGLFERGTHRVGERGSHPGVGGRARPADRGGHPAVPVVRGVGAARDSGRRRLCRPDPDDLRVPVERVADRVHVVRRLRDRLRRPRSARTGARAGWHRTTMRAAGSSWLRSWGWAASAWRRS